MLPIVALLTDDQPRIKSINTLWNRKADKGNTTIVMDHCEYTMKVNEFLDSSGVVHDDVFILNPIVLKLNNLYETHEPDTPIHSFISNPLYKLAKHLNI